MKKLKTTIWIFRLQSQINTPKKGKELAKVFQIQLSKVKT